MSDQVLVGTTDGAPGYSVVCYYLPWTECAREAYGRLSREGRNPKWVDADEARRGIGEFRAWRDAK